MLRSFLVLLMICSSVDYVWAARRTTHIVKAEAVVHEGRTCLNVLSNGRLAPEIYKVSSPERIVIDATDAEFRLILLPKSISAGRIMSFRFGPIDGERARIVVDVTQGTRVGRVLSKPLRGELHLSSISLVGGKASDDRTCEKYLSSHRQAGAWSATIRGGSRLSEQPDVKGQSSKPVIVIDPGHGGIDPGAVVNKVYLEKAIVLAVGRRVAKRLRKTGRFRVVLTRDADSFVSLDDRVERTRQDKGDLFISLHADSIDSAAQALRTQGAAVYILSHRASDRLAKRLADKENAADLPAGILPKKASGGKDVRGILVDLLARETENSSTRLRKFLVDSMRSRVRLSRQPLRSAAFRVLKQAETPAALVELGYMSNPGDLKRMRQAVWQEQMAAAIAAAVQNFFNER